MNGSTSAWILGSSDIIASVSKPTCFRPVQTMRMPEALPSGGGGGAKLGPCQHYMGGTWTYGNRCKFKHEGITHGSKGKGKNKSAKTRASTAPPPQIAAAARKGRIRIDKGLKAPRGRSLSRNFGSRSRSRSSKGGKRHNSSFARRKRSRNGGRKTRSQISRSNSRRVRARKPRGSDSSGSRSNKKARRGRSQSRHGRQRGRMGSRSRQGDGGSSQGRRYGFARRFGGNPHALYVCEKHVRGKCYSRIWPQWSVLPLPSIRRQRPVSIW